MATGRLVKVAIEVLAVEREVWCPRCAKSTGAYLAFVQHLPNGTMTAGRIRRCNECGEPIPGA
ncbi:hypothetical protein OEB99_16585 [Actinotalea sp. M2MS4P-6]|uniref:hypothetical protein n=1 Tax=Actinotalea sp. M2MS4P-6 TaxID=2983762 RepID=UPI0021E39D35|nr:hypothetical protein [Actinotalea sp. M2MS4P-6]MCV2395934.1 hypothetical protein [Actinotalea sp. M2MS4P-6]